MSRVEQRVDEGKYLMRGEASRSGGRIVESLKDELFGGRTNRWRANRVDECCRVTFLEGKGC